jgi:putative ABC transport system permease protein
MTDLRLAIRSLRATPIVAAVAILSLALGIGANTAIFSLVDSLLLRTLPVPQPDRLVLLSTAARRNVSGWSIPVWEEIRRRPDLFDKAAGWSPARLNLATGGETQFVDGIWATGSFFQTLGVRALLGRTFSEDDDRPGGSAAGPVMVISYGFWQRHFGGALDVIGRRLTLGGVPVSIIGVTPADFSGIDVGRAFEVALPISDELLVNGRDSLLAGGGFAPTIIARLKPSQTYEGATAGLRAAQPAIREAVAPPIAGASGADSYIRDALQSPFTLVPAATGHSFVRGRYALPLIVILSAAGLVLLIACANVANLLLARATARRHELSLRVALGASRWRLVRSLLAESALLAAGAVGLGVPLASWASRLLVRQLSTDTRPLSLDLSTDWRLLAFSLTIALATLVLFGVAPALRASRVDPMDALKEHARGSAGDSRPGFAGALVVAQVALSLVLVAMAGLLIQTFTSLARRDLGFARDELLVVQIESRRAIDDPRQRAPIYERVRDAVRAVPGVSDAALSNLTPLADVVFDPPIEVSGSGPLSPRERSTYAYLVTPRWFSTFGIGVVAGRDFAESDRVGAPLVAIVNLAFAKKFLNGASPLDHTITLPAVMYAPGPSTGLRVVGVVADAVYGSVREPLQPTLYMALAQHDEAFFARGLGSLSLNVRAAQGSPTRLTKSIVAAIARVGPRLAVTVHPLAKQVDDSLARDRVVAMLAAFFGALALLLAGLGLYGVTSYAVSRRRTEIGIRMALGAAPGSVVRLVLSRVTRLVGIGVLVGAAVSVWASQFVATLLYGLEARDPATLIAAAVVLGAVGAAAGWLPAYRASRIDPAEVLRDS